MSQSKQEKKSSFSINFSVKDLFNAVVHYGHKASLWNPKMKPYIFRKENDVHVINLAETHRALVNAVFELYKAAKSHKRILFVGTKQQCSKSIKKYAIECGQHYVNHKWLGGMLTNFSTIKSLSKTLEQYENDVQKDSESFTKKELLMKTKQIEKLERYIGGIRHLSRKPDVIFVIDSSHDAVAIREANKTGAMVIAVVDTNSSPDNIDIVIPGNDDSIKSIDLYLRLASEAVLQGIKDGIAEA